MGEARRVRVARVPATATVGPPSERGPLLTDVAVARLLSFDDAESARRRRWVREHVPGKLRIGHNTIRWFEDDVLTWAASRAMGVRE